MPRIASVIYVSLPVIDIIVQLLICYICWTVGSSEQLKRFDCILIEDGQGGFLIKYKLKQDVPETIGEAYAATIEMNEEDESMDLEVSQGLRDQTIWRERNLG